MCADEYPTATEKVKIIFDMHQSHDAEKRREWVATTHPLVAEGSDLNKIWYADILTAFEDTCNLHGSRHL